MKKLILLFFLSTMIYTSIASGSTAPSGNTGILSLDLTSDTQVEIIDEIPETIYHDARFRPIHIKVIMITKNNISIFWEGDITDEKDINICVPPGIYEVYVKEHGKYATWVYDNNEKGYKIFSNKTTVIPLAVNTLGLDVVADVPWRIEPNKDIPLLLMVKDANQNDYPIYEIRIYDDILPYGSSSGEDVLIETIDLYGSGTCFGKTYLNIDHDWYFEDSTGSIPKLDPDDFTRDSNGIIHIYVHYDAATLCDPLNIDTVSYISLYYSDYYLPSLSNWYAGDVHYHSNYTDNYVEFGFPTEATSEAGKAIGLNWTTITDHSFDLDSYMPSLDEIWKWDKIGNDCLDVSNGGYSDSEFKLIRGEEVSCTNIDGKFIHFLAYGITDVIKGEGANGLNYAGDEDNTDTNGDGWDDHPKTYSLSEVITNINNQNGFGYAAHPEAHPWHDELFDRGNWQPGDYNLEGYAGLQIWNTKNNDAARDTGLEIWKGLLINKSRRIFISGGSDAHGDFSHMTTIIGELDNAYGIVRTYIYTEDFSEDGILNALKSGNSIMTDGPLLIFNVTNKQVETAIIGDEIIGCDLTLNIQWESTPEFGNIDHICIHRGIIGENEEEINEYHLTPRCTSGKKVYSDLTDKIPQSKTAYIRLNATTDTGHSVYTNPIWIIVDTISPVLFIDPVISPTNVDSQIVTGAMEKGATVIVTCPNATVGTVDYPTNITWSVDITNMTEGENLITVIATDRAGNTRAVNTAIEFKIPIITGNGTISIGSETVDVNSTFVLQLNISNATGLQQVSLDLIYDPEVVTVLYIIASDILPSSNISYNFSSGNASIEITNPDNITVIDATPLIDITLRAGEDTGTTALEMLNVVLINDSGPHVPDKIANGSITVCIKGDFNYNNRVDIGDAAKVAFMVAGKVPGNSRADFNHNSRVDVGDAAKISFYLANKVSTL